MALGIHRNIRTREVMAIFDLFSKRQKILRGDVPDVYVYDDVPNSLRVQIVHIWQDCLGNDEEYYDSYVHVKSGYQFIVDTLCREYGLFQLGDARKQNRHYMEELFNFFLHEENAEKAIDVIELSFRYADLIARKHDYRRVNNPSTVVDSAIEELNSRLKEHGVGYQFEEGEIIRVDSQLIHSEAVKPALALLSNKDYEGAQQEFLNSYEHYRHGKNKESLNDALKAFESTLKTICTKQGWAFTPKDGSKRLLDLCYSNDLIPTFWQQHMTALRSLLEGGVPTGRNKLSGHGQGTQPVTVPGHIVAYVLHMTAAAIVFLVKSEQELK